ncbi:MAG: hypothetical protein WA709_24785 [Stellaceae bacterium]
MAGRIWSGFFRANEETALNPYPFYFVERAFVASAVVELGRARAFVRGHGLGILEGADAAGPKYDSVMARFSCVGYEPK